MGVLKRKKKLKKIPRKGPIIENLEPRILLSADLPGLDAVLTSGDDLHDVDTAKVLADAQAEFERQRAADDATQKRDVERADSAHRDLGRDRRSAKNKHRAERGREPWSSARLFVREDLEQLVGHPADRTVGTRLGTGFPGSAVS